MASFPSFIHLRCTTPYSLLEGAVPIADLLGAVKAAGMPAVGIADRDSMAGALEFSEAARDKGVQPILGASVRLAPARGSAGGYLTLYAKDGTGYRNLLALTSEAYLSPADEASCPVPNLSLESLKRASSGLLCLTGAPSEGLLAETLRCHTRDAALFLLRRLGGIFPDRLYVELQRHGMESESQVESALLRLALDEGVPLAATNQVLFLDEDFYEAHEVLLSIASNSRIFDEDRPRRTPWHRFLSAAEMEERFRDVPEALANTVVIAERCAFFPRAQPPSLPTFTRESRAGPASAGSEADAVDEESALRALAHEGLARRLSGALFAPPESYQQRLDYELDLIIRTGFAGYFLIVADFVRWARKKGIAVGPGRGSGAASVVSWSLTITDLDPLRWGLVFERFLNPERISMPDFDIDFCQERRGEVIDYITKRYGAARVAQIGTYGTLQARAALRDVGRVLGVSLGLVDRMCRFVPPFSGRLPETYEKEEGFRDLCRDSPDARKTYEIASRLEGLFRHASTHAAGIVISDEAMHCRAPLFREAHASLPTTQFSMKWVERAGLVKFDLLGLRTLTIIEHATRMIRAHAPDFDPEQLPLDDPRTFALLRRADTVGIFQLESGGMREAIRRAQPSRFEDIVALVALYRPGPMDYIPDYVAGKRDEASIRYLHPELEPILRETYGVIVYQEQVLQIARDLAGYTLGQADVLRKAMGKKIKSEMRGQEKKFMAGAAAHGIEKGTAQALFNLIELFAGYGFNKAHAASYALLAYRTAYLKAHYPAEFIAALITHEMGSSDRIDAYHQELRRLGFTLLPPSVNSSEAGFTVEREGRGGAPEGGGGKVIGVRYGLAAIRNFGESAARALVELRGRDGPFLSLEDLMRRAARGVFNKRALEQLAASGALDELVAHRRLAYAAARNFSHGGFDEPAAQPLSLLDEGARELPRADSARDGPSDRDSARRWTANELMRYEFEALGLYLSDHPLASDSEALRASGVLPLSEVEALDPGAARTVRIAGVIVSVSRRRARKGQPYAFVRLSDPSGLFETMIFSDTLREFRALLEEGGQVVLDAGVEAAKSGEGVRVAVRRVTRLDDYLRDLQPRWVRLRLESLEGGAGENGSALERALADVRAALARADGGAGRVRLACSEPGRGRAELELSGGWKISRALLHDLRAIPGVDLEEMRA